MNKAVLVAGLGFGDEGKGSIVQFLAQDLSANLIVRYNGGAQAAHNVVLRDGRHHTFAQFGSATLEGARTHLSRFMLVEPHALLHEGRHLVQLGVADPYALLTIDREALLITPFHWFANRLREIIRSQKHGSCGAGIGETMSDFLAHGPEVPVMGDLEDPTRLKKKLKFVQDQKIAEFEKLYLDVSLPDAAHRALKRLLDSVDRVVESYQGITDVLNLVNRDFLATSMKDTVTIFEGAQGVLLDQDYGFHPHTTWTNITFDNAEALLQEAGFKEEVEKVGVVRTFMTRHGNGPLPTEMRPEEQGARVFDRHNGTGLWQGKLRVGEFDIPLVKYSLDVLGGADTIALTHADKRHEFDTIASRYAVMRNEYRKFVDESLTCTGFLRPIKPQVDLKYQELLSIGLSSGGIIPTYIDQPPELEEFIEEVAARLRTPITIISDGPRLEDKYRL